ncbi:MAG TPA: hypothetical protein VK978_03760 [Candidatus Saccharimonadales bacterium]|nr:hypothetical protein [Candidatus Saccharimonadales bacterium]
MQPTTSGVPPAQQPTYAPQPSTPAASAVATTPVLPGTTAVPPPVPLAASPSVPTWEPTAMPAGLQTVEAPAAASAPVSMAQFWQPVQQATAQQVTATEQTVATPPVAVQPVSADAGTVAPAPVAPSSPAISGVAVQSAVQAPAVQAAPLPGIHTGSAMGGSQSRAFDDVRLAGLAGMMGAGIGFLTAFMVMLLGNYSFTWLVPVTLAVAGASFVLYRSSDIKLTVLLIKILMGVIAVMMLYAFGRGGYLAILWGIVLFFLCKALASLYKADLTTSDKPWQAQAK